MTHIKKCSILDDLGFTESKKEEFKERLFIAKEINNIMLTKNLFTMELSKLKEMLAKLQEL